MSQIIFPGHTSHTDGRGTITFRQYGRLHREDGPAVEYEDGNVAWYIHGQEYKFDLWHKKLLLDDKTIAKLALEYG